MITIRRSEPRATFRRVYFTAVNVNNLQTRLTAANMTGGTWSIRIAKNGSSEAASAAATPTEISAANRPGEFYAEIPQSECDTAGALTIRIGNTGGTFSMEPREIEIPIDESPVFTAVTGTLTAASFTTSMTEATANHWKGAIIRWLTGTLRGQIGKISAYTTGLVTMDATFGTFTGAPANGDVFEIMV